MDPLEIRQEFSESVFAHDYSEGPLLILAGPGTGKTFSLIETIRRKTNNGLSIDDFYEATLTNAAAEDFLSDVHEKVSEEFSTSSTLHYRAKGILHNHAQMVGLDPGFTVIDDSCEGLILADLETLLGMEAAELRSALLTYRRHVASNMTISSEYSQAYRQIQKFYSALDWFDVMRLACILLTNNEEIRDYEASRFEFLLIDEYQDLNQSDQQFVELLLNERNTLLAVGDDDQSIYSGRFADSLGIIEFNDRYPNAEVIPLPVTSRNPTAIINASYQLISNNIDRAKKDKLMPLLETDDRASGGFIVSVNTRSGIAEAEFVYNALLRLIEENVPPEEILVLCLCRPLGLELINRIRDLDEDNRIPIRNELATEGDVSSEEYMLFQLFRLLADPSDNLAARVVIEGVADGEVDEIRRLVIHALEGNINIWEALGDEDFLENLPAIGSDLQNLRQQIEALDPELSNREKAHELVGNYPPLAKIESALRVEDEPQSSTEQPSPDIQDSIRFITLHSSKGLDADFVLIPFLEEDLSLPAKDEEEMRRLLYVALVRAKVGAAMSWAWSRRTDRRFHCAGIGGPNTSREPSRFITECGVSPNLVPPWEEGSAPDQAVELLGQHARAIYSN